MNSSLQHATNGADLDAIFSHPHCKDSNDDDTDDATEKFFDAKSYFETMNYWDDNDDAIGWHDTALGDNQSPPKSNEPFHLSIACQTVGDKEKGQQHEVVHTTDTVVNAMLGDMDWSELVGQHMPFDTLCFGTSAVQKLQRLEELQPALAWKPLEVIKQTLDAAAQWATQKHQFSMKNHHQS